MRRPNRWLDDAIERALVVLLQHGIRKAENWQLRALLAEPGSKLWGTLGPEPACWARLEAYVGGVHDEKAAAVLEAVRTEVRGFRPPGVSDQNPTAFSRALGRMVKEGRLWEPGRRVHDVYAWNSNWVYYDAVKRPALVNAIAYPELRAARRRVKELRNSGRTSIPAAWAGAPPSAGVEDDVARRVLVAADELLGRTVEVLSALHEELGGEGPVTIMVQAAPHPRSKYWSPEQASEFKRCALAALEHASQSLETQVPEPSIGPPDVGRQSSPGD